MLMSIISLPSYELYWSKDLRIDCVANVMSLEWYELVRRYLHVNDNTEKREDSSRLSKVEPVVDTLRRNCFFTNWFSTLPLLSKLKTVGILSIATFHSQITLVDAH